MKKPILCLLSLLCLTGCGFKFHHEATFPKEIHPLSIQYGQVSSDWSFRLKQRLDGATSHIINTPKSRHYSLFLESETIQQHILSIGSGGSPRQYQIIYELSYSFQDQKHTIKIYRLSTLNNDRILGSQDEQEQTLDSIKNDAASQMIEQIAQYVKESHSIIQESAP